MPFAPPHWIATGALKHHALFKHQQHCSPTLKLLAGRPWPIFPSMFAPAGTFRIMLWEPVAHMLAAVLRTAFALLSSTNSLALFHSSLRGTAQKRSTTIPSSAERSLALVLHNTPTSVGHWEHLVSSTTLDALPDVLWKPLGRRSGVDIAVCPGRPPAHPLHKVRGEGLIAAPAAVVLALVEGVHTAAQWEPSHRDGHVLHDSWDNTERVRTQLLWSRHVSGV